MSDPTTTPAPTEPHRDARERVIDALFDTLAYSRWAEADRWAVGRAADAVLAAVSAAAPDEREALAAAMHAEVCCPCDPTGCDVSDVPEMRYADAALAWFTTRPAPTVNAADVWAEWLFDIGYPFDISWPENPPPVDHAVLARLWNERDDWRISDDDAEACVRNEAGLTVADDPTLTDKEA